MSKTFLVLRHEFRRHVTRRSFLFAVLGLPALFIFIIGAMTLFLTGRARQPVGIIDHAHILIDPEIFHDLRARRTVPFHHYPDEAAARAALDAGDIQAYALLPAGYLDNGRLTLYHRGDTYEGIDSDLNLYIRASLLAGHDPLLIERFHRQPDITVISLAPEAPANNFLAPVLSFVIGFLFLIAIFSTSGLLIQAIVDEKENRTMEILITSLSPEQLMIGKILGLTSLGLVQVAVWLSLAAAGFLLLTANLPQLPLPEISRLTLITAVAWFLPFYIMIAALMAAVGISVSTVGEAQQVVSIVSILAMFPLYFTFLIVENPNSLLVVTLSLIPFSAPLTILTRVQVTAVPIQQLLASWLILITAAALALFLVSRLLRAGMLRYGQRLTLREIAHALRPRRS